MAANAKDLIKNIEVVDSLDEALKNIILLLVHHQE